MVKTDYFYRYEKRVGLCCHNLKVYTAITPLHFRSFDGSSTGVPTPTFG